jgi:hypothetical protein
MKGNIMTIHPRHGAITHGLTVGNVKHPIYKLRERMVYYCHKVPESNKRVYPRYRGRGIIVCDEWRNDMVKFYNWCMDNGWKKGLCLDRIDNNGNYEPLNCQFLTQSEHAKKSQRDTPQKGEDIGTSVLSDDEVRAIRLLFKCGYSSGKISEFFNTGRTTIKYIGSGRTWRHIGE